MDNTLEAPENLIDRLRRWYVAARETMGEAKLLASLDDETVKLLAQDNALTVDELRSLIRKGPHAGDEMVALMRLLGIDPDKARLAEPEAFREMHVACAHCGAKSRCRQDLAGENGETDLPGYCGNTAQLSIMRATPELLADKD